MQDALIALLEIDFDKLQAVDPKRYLFGILKNKITDRLRKRYSGEVSYCEAFSDDLDVYLFNERSHWIEGVAPAGWHRPDERLQTDQFFAVVRAQLTDQTCPGVQHEGVSGVRCR